jgi:hypothetical protein
MELNVLNRAAVRRLLSDAEALLALTTVEESRGPAMLKVVNSLRTGHRDLTRLAMPLMMTDDELITFLLKLDRVRACLRVLGETD